MHQRPRAVGRPKSILASASRSGLGFGVGLVFFVALGFSCSAFAVVSFCPCRWFVFGVGRPVWRLFRSSSMLVRVWCWFCSLAYGACRSAYLAVSFAQVVCSCMELVAALRVYRRFLDVLRVRWFRFLCSLVHRLASADPCRKVERSRRRRAAFKSRPAYTGCEKRPAGRRSGILRSEWPKQTPP